MSGTEEVIDEHLAKFPPFEGPRIGGNFEVDENVTAGQRFRVKPQAFAASYVGLTSVIVVSLALPVPGTEIISANTYGYSIWGRTAKIVCRTPDNRIESYFHKVGTSIPLVC
jgi:protein-ribulosamine 3-kinase